MQGRAMRKETDATSENAYDLGEIGEDEDLVGEGLLDVGDRSGSVTRARNDEATNIAPREDTRKVVTGWLRTDRIDLPFHLDQVDVAVELDNPVDLLDHPVTIVTPPSKRLATQYLERTEEAVQHAFECETESANNSFLIWSRAAFVSIRD